MSTSRCCRSILVALAMALIGSLLAAAPAEAIPGSMILGHRCRTYSAEVTNENTITALRDTGGIEGAWCEIDLWRISDGTLIVWHDSTWGRVADHASLPAGVKPTDNVVKATAAQVSSIRTKGGDRVATFAEMIEVAGQLNVTLIAEVRNSVPQPATWVDYAESKSADVRYYKRPGADCGMVVLERLRDAGAKIGLNMGGAVPPCGMTPPEMQAKGVSFITINVGKVTPALTSDLRSRGIEAYAAVATKSNYKTALTNGATKVMVDRPRDALRW